MRSSSRSQRCSSSLWLDERKSWQLAAAAVLLSGAFLTKREGLYSELASSLPRAPRPGRTAGGRGRGWPYFGAAAFVLALPWRVGCGRGLSKRFARGRFLRVPRRLRPRARLALARRTGDVRVRPLARASRRRGRRRCSRLPRRCPRGAVFTLVFIGATLAANAWVTLTNPVTISLDYSLNPATRFMVTPLLVVASVLPPPGAGVVGQGGRPHAPTRVAVGSAWFAPGRSSSLRWFSTRHRWQRFLELPASRGTPIPSRAECERGPNAGSRCGSSSATRVPTLRRACFASAPSEQGSRRPRSLATGAAGCASSSRRCLPSLPASSS